MGDSRKDSDRTPTTVAPDRTLRYIRSSELFTDSNRILIEHGGAVYKLQVTSQGKLLLTK